MSTQPRKFSEVFLRGVRVGLGSRFDIIKLAKVNLLSIYMNAREPFSSTLVPTDAFISTLIAFLKPCIALVFRLCRLSQIIKSIIMPPRIDMVDLIARPLPPNVEPYESMSGVFHAAYCDVNVSEPRQTTSNVPRISHTA